MDKELLKRFLESISMNESTGGRNLEHALVTKGLHKGTKAYGRYGLMPRTIQEMAKRFKIPGTEAIVKAKPSEVNDLMTPEIEQAIAEKMAERQLERYGDPAVAAASWRFGHNLSPEQAAKRAQKEGYVKAFQEDFQKRSIPPTIRRPGLARDVLPLPEEEQYSVEKIPAVERVPAVFPELMKLLKPKFLEEDDGV